MGDYTAAQVVIYACPADQVDAVLDVLDQYDYAEDFDYALGHARTETLTLCTAYGDSEARLGTNDEIASALTELEGVAFAAWDDPKYEWLGQLTIHVPELGAYSAQCDANGTVVLDADVLVKHLRAGTLTEAVLGVPWSDALIALSAANEGVVLHRADEED